MNTSSYCIIPGLNERHKPLTLFAIRMVIENVCKFYGISEFDMKYKKTRVPDEVLPRQMASYLLCIFTKFTYMRIGRLVGGYDHATVIHSYRKIVKRSEADNDFNKDRIRLIREIQKSIPLYRNDCEVFGIEQIKYIKFR